MFNIAELKHGRGDKKARAMPRTHALAHSQRELISYHATVQGIHWCRCEITRAGGGGDGDQDS